jgi:hypothetical protein
MITLLAIVLITILLLYLVQLVPADGRILLALQAIIIIIAVIMLARAAGLS